LEESLGGAIAERPLRLAHHGAARRRLIVAARRRLGQQPGQRGDRQTLARPRRGVGAIAFGFIRAAGAP
jgi:hypothetical protein